jgi:hypothetical protein
MQDFHLQEAFKFCYIGLYPQLRPRTACSAASLMGPSLLCLKVKSGRTRDLTKAMTMAEIEASIMPLEINKSASLAQYLKSASSPLQQHSRPSFLQLRKLSILFLRCLLQTGLSFPPQNPFDIFLESISKLSL